jgi:uncharacterized membrane protein affecting hemolysin expression
VSALAHNMHHDQTDMDITTDDMADEERAIEAAAYEEAERLDAMAEYVWRDA